jgi:hypothetical protein
MSRIYTVVRKASEPSAVTVIKSTPAPPRHDSTDSVLVAVHREKPADPDKPRRSGKAVL